MIQLFSTHCPNCIRLELKLKEKNIKYSICDNIEEITSKGYMTAPILIVDDKEMTYQKAIEWLNGKD